MSAPVSSPVPPLPAPPPVAETKCCPFIVVKRIAVGFLSIVQVALSTAIIVINATRLSQIKVETPTYLPLQGPNVTIITVSCLIQGDRGGANICQYVFVVCAVALGVYIGTAALLCLTCNLCGLGAILELLLHLVQTGWWVAASITLTTYINNTNDDGWPREGDRNAVLAMSWTSVPVAFIMAIFTSIEVGQWCRDYCVCCCCYRKLSPPAGRDLEQQAAQDEVERKAEADALAAEAAEAAAAPDFLLEPDPAPTSKMAPVAEVQLAAEPMQPPKQQVVEGGGLGAQGTDPGLKGTAV